MKMYVLYFGDKSRREEFFRSNNAEAVYERMERLNEIKVRFGQFPSFFVAVE